MFAPVYGCLIKDSNTEKETKKESLLDNPKEICNQCLKFLDDGHYDNDPNMLPLYLTENPRSKDRGFSVKYKQYNFYF